MLVGKDDMPRRLPYLDAVKRLRAAVDEPGYPLDGVEERHFRQAGRAMELYNQLLQQQDTSLTMRVNSHDKVVLGALKFLRTEAMNAMSDEHGREMCRRLLALVDQGVYNSLPRDLSALAKQQRSSRCLSRDELEQQIVELADTFCPDIEEENETTVANAVPDIIISETFID